MSIRPKASFVSSTRRWKLLLGGNVRCDRLRRLAPACAIDGGERPRRRRRTPCAKKMTTVAPCSAKMFGTGAPDAARGAGDDRNAPGQIEQAGQGFPSRSDSAGRRLHCSLRRRQEGVAGAGFPAPRIRHDRSPPLQAGEGWITDDCPFGVHCKTSSNWTMVRGFTRLGPLPRQAQAIG